MAIEHLFVWITLFIAPFASFLVLLSLKRNIDRLGQLPYLVAMSEILMVLLYSSDLTLAAKGIILMPFSMVYVALFALVLPDAAKDFQAEYLDLPQKQTRKITEDLLLDKGWIIAYSKNSPLMFEAPSKFGRVRGKITLRELEGKTLVGVKSTIGIRALTLLAIISLVGLFLSGMVFAFIGAGIEDFWFQEESVIVFPILAGVLTFIFTQNSSRIGKETIASLGRYLVDKATQVIMAQHVAQRVLTAPKRTIKETKLQVLERTKNLAAKFMKKSEDD
ncbi:MAG: hypothetical protein ACE5I5_17380 [Candidatus Heimdallarchaeota archaeon]